MTEQMDAAAQDRQQQDVQQEHRKYVTDLGDWRRTQHCGQLTIADDGAEVCLMGWVQYRRDHGGLIFVDLRDREGLTQVVFSPDMAPAAHANAHILRSEYVLAIKGRVRPRPEGMVNPNLVTGQIEVVVYEWKLLNTSKTPPFPIEDRCDAGENLRLAWRYLDLRRPRMQANLRLRHRVAQCVRRFLDENGFTEVETPVLQTMAGGANARPFITHHNALDADMYLRISLELYLKRLIVGGFDRVYEIGRVFRNEGLSVRHNPEFTLLELYQAYTDFEGMMNLTEDLIKYLACDVLKTPIVKYGEYELDLAKPFERLTMKQAVKKYAGVDFVKLSGVVTPTKAT